MSLKTIVRAESFRPLHDHVFVTELESGMTKSAGGIILTDDNVTERGIRARWGRIYAVGPKVTDVKVGEWILTEHGRWTERVVLTNEAGDTVHIWRVEFPKATLLVSDEDPRVNKPTKV